MENARLVSLLVVLLSLLALACGGDDADRRRTTPDWEPSQRVPTSSERWWAEPVERYCEEDRECRQGGDLSAGPPRHVPPLPARRGRPDLRRRDRRAPRSRAPLRRYQGMSSGSTA